MNREALSLQLEDHLRSERTTAPVGFYFTDVTPPSGQGAAVDALYFAASSRSDTAATVDIFLLAVDRADWLAHQRTPTPEIWASYATRCWIVAAGQSVAAADEVPSRWGLMVAEPPGAASLFTVAKRPHSRRALIDAALLQTLLTNQHASHVQRIGGIRTQFQRRAGQLTPSRDQQPAEVPPTGLGPPDGSLPLNEASPRNSLPTQPESGHRPAAPELPRQGQSPPHSPQGKASTPRAVEVIPA